MKTIYLFYTTLLLALSVPFSQGHGQEADMNISENSIQASSRFLPTDLFISGQDKVSQYAIPSLVTTNKGTLIAVCYARVDKPGDAPNNIDLVMKRSFDNGKTWTKQETIVNFPDNDAAADASMVVDKQTGVIWLAYDYAIAYPQGQLGRIIRIHIIKSSDNGATWSKSVNLNYLTRGKSFGFKMPPAGGYIQKEEF